MNDDTSQDESPRDPETPAAEIARLKQWVDDLQSGMYVNCVYCGHRYGPEATTPVSMAEALRRHVEQCPKHPMSAIKTAGRWAMSQVGAIERLHTHPDRQWRCKYCNAAAAHSHHVTHEDDCPYARAREAIAATPQ